jgi:hypothetical protein
MTLILVLILIAVSLVLIGFGFYASSNSGQPNEDEMDKITKSGQYSIVKESPRKKLKEHKPSLEDIKSWVSDQDLSDEQKEQLINRWTISLEESITAIEHGDRSGVEIYGYEIKTSDPVICSFIDDSTYVTREQIYNYPELLPPFYPGDATKIIPKEAWFGDEKADWVSLLPVQGKYQVPDWRHFEL